MPARIHQGLYGGVFIARGLSNVFVLVELEVESTEDMEVALEEIEDLVGAGCETPQVRIEAFESAEALIQELRRQHSEE